MKPLTCSSEERPVSLSQSQGFARALLTLEETSCLPTALSLSAICPAGWCGKTSPEFLVPTEDGISLPCSGRWKNSGMGGPTVSLTLNTSEWPKDAAVCSLSDILETGDLPQRYFLSAKACAGILRRAEKRGKTLPTALLDALTVATGTAKASG